MRAVIALAFAKKCEREIPKGGIEDKVERRRRTCQARLRWIRPSLGDIAIPGFKLDAGR